MTVGHGDDIHAVGGSVRHIPVLLGEVLEALAPAEGDIIIDGTFGAGGYTKAILATGASVVAIDRDPDAIAAGRDLEAQSGGRLRLVQAPFSTLDEHVENADGVVLDIGVSSMQLDQAARGFSFRADGPLDMRMAQAGLTAADVVNSFKPGDLARIFGFLGEERHAGRIARMIEARREKRPFERTLELADAIETHIGRAPKDKIHPATRVFQALRIYVNDELGELAKALFAAERALKPGGRLVVVTFHSLEDRIVKRFIADRADVATGSRHLPEAHARTATFRKAGGGVTADDAEVAANPRARSARLRAAIRTDARARGGDFSIFGLPKLPGINLPGRGKHVFRTSDIVLIAVMVSAAALTYKTKREAEDQLAAVQKIHNQIRYEEETIDLLKADWSLLTQPSRLQKLAELYKSQLALEPVSARQIVGLSDLPAKALDIQDILKGRQDSMADSSDKAPSGDKDPVVTGDIAQ